MCALGETGGADPVGVGGRLRRVAEVAGDDDVEDARAAEGVEDDLGQWRLAAGDQGQGHAALAQGGDQLRRPLLVDDPLPGAGRDPADEPVHDLPNT